MIAVGLAVLTLTIGATPDGGGESGARTLATTSTPTTSVPTTEDGGTRATATTQDGGAAIADAGTRVASPVARPPLATGVVLMPDGSPAARAELHAIAWFTDGGRSVSTFADAAGQFTLLRPDVPGPLVSLNLWASLHGHISALAKLRTIDGPITLRLQPPGRLTVKVTDARGRPASATVRISTALYARSEDETSGEILAQPPTQVDARHTFEDIPAGDAMVVVGEGDMPNDRLGCARAKLEPGGEATVTVALRKRGKVTLRVLDPETEKPYPFPVDVTLEPGMDPDGETRAHIEKEPEPEPYQPPPDPICDGPGCGPRPLSGRGRPPPPPPPPRKPSIPEAEVEELIAGEQLVRMNDIFGIEAYRVITIRPGSNGVQSILFKVQAKPGETGFIAAPWANGLTILGKPGTPGGAAKLAPGTMLLSIDGKTPHDEREAQAWLDGGAPGSTVRIRVSDSGRERELTVKRAR